MVNRSGRVPGAANTASTNCCSLSPRSRGVRGSPWRARQASIPSVSPSSSRRNDVNRLAAPASSPWLAVPGEQVVDRVQDLVVAAAARPARPCRRHREPGKHERLRQRDQEAVVVDPVLAVHDRSRGDARERHGDAVDLLAALALGQPPVGDRRQVADRVADPRSPHRRLRPRARSRGRPRPRSASARRRRTCAAPRRPRERRRGRRCRRATGWWRPRPAGARRGSPRTSRRRSSGRRRSRPPRRRTRLAGAPRARRRPVPSRPRRPRSRRSRAADAASRRSPRRAQARRPPQRARHWRSAGPRAAAPGRRPLPPRCRSSAGCRPGGSAAARDLPRPGEVDVVVDLDPLDGTDRSDARRARHGRRALGSRPRSTASYRAARLPRARPRASRRRPAQSTSRRCTRPARSPDRAPC